MTVSPDGTVAAHELWFPALASLVDQATRVEIAAAVARRANVRHAFDEAIDVATQHCAWDAALEAVLGLVMGGESFPGHGRVLSLYERFPVSMRSEPELLLLHALAARVSNAPGAGAAEAAQALDLFQQRGSPRSIAAAAFEVGYGAWLRGDLARLMEMYEIARVLTAEGHHFLDPMVFLIEAIAADLRGDASAAATLLASVDLASIPAPLGIYVLRDLMSKLQLIGESARAVSYCDSLHRLTGDARVAFTIALAHWSDGTPEPVIEHWEQLRHRTIGQNHTDFLTWVYSTVIDASLGIVSDLAAMPDFSPGRSREEAMRALGRGAAFVAAGDEARAIDELRSLEKRVGFDDLLVAGELRRQLPLGYVLLESVRAHIDSDVLGPSHRRRLVVAKTVLAVRAGRSVDWSTVASVDELLTALPLRWTVEVITAAHRDGHGDAVGWTVRADELTNGRVGAELNTLAQASSQLRDAAAALVDTLGSSGLRLNFSVFGPLILVRQSHHNTPECISFSRKRVRQLLGILVLCEQVAVNEVLQSLWPSLPDHEARNNLAATIRFARQIVDGVRESGAEPDRSASLIVRDEAHIRLRSRNGLTTDLWEVRRLMALAKRQRTSGNVKAAMQSVAEAVQYWTGPILDDLCDLEPFGAWCVAELQDLSSGALDLAEWNLSQGDFASAERTARTVLASDGFDERAHAVLIQALLEKGDPSPVVLAVAECRAALGELGVNPNRSLAMILRRADR